MYLSIKFALIQSETTSVIDTTIVWVVELLSPSTCNNYHHADQQRTCCMSYYLRARIPSISPSMVPVSGQVWDAVWPTPTNSIVTLATSDLYVLGLATDLCPLSKIKSGLRSLLQLHDAVYWLGTWQLQHSLNEPKLSSLYNLNTTLVLVCIVSS